MQRLKEDESVAESAKMRRGARRAMGARMYMPEIGRFLAVDPLAEAFPTQSPYNFAYNNPINFRDPSGLAPEKEKGDRVLSTTLDPLIGSSYRYIVSSRDRAEAFLEAYEEWSVDCARLAMDELNALAAGLSYGNGGGGSNGVSQGSSSTSIWKTLLGWTGLFDDDEETKSQTSSEWVWNGVDYGTRESLVAAGEAIASKQNADYQQENDGLRTYQTPELEVIAICPQQFIYDGSTLALDAWWHYGTGGNKFLHINMETLNMGDLTMHSTPIKNAINAKGKKGSLNTIDYGKNMTSIAIGKVDFVYLGNNRIRFEPDKYDFDLTWDFSWKGIKRNTYTLGYGIFHGVIHDIPFNGNFNNGPYWIVFHGSKELKP